MTEKSPLQSVGDAGSHRGAMGQIDSSPSDWTLQFSGELEKPYQLTLHDFQQMAEEEMTLKIRCISAGAIFRPRGAMARFRGIYLDQLLPLVGLTTDAEDRPVAQTVRFFSKAPGQCGPPSESHETSLEMGLCSTSKQVMLAWQVGGLDLPYENGGPLRTIVDGTAFDGRARYFYKSLKWLGGMEFVRAPIEQCPGTWERYAGYNVRGRIGDSKVDPFFRLTDSDGIPRRVSDPQQRFAAILATGDLSRIVAAELETVVGDFLADPRWVPGLTFATEFDESGQPRYRTALRGTNFRGRDLRDWDFSHVNFSLSSFTAAVLGDASNRRAAKLNHCDLEGAVFYDADLRNVEMTRAYLAGVRFCGDGGSKPATVQGLDITGAQGLTSETLDWLVEHGAIV